MIDSTFYHLRSGIDSEIDELIRVVMMLLDSELVSFLILPSTANICL